MVQGPPTRIYAFVFAILAGALLVTGRILAGVILTVIALALVYAAYRAGGGHDGLI